MLHALTHRNKGPGIRPAFSAFCPLVALHNKGYFMKQFDPFPEVSSKYGSPIGRRGDNPANLQDCKRLHARRQGGGDGYDRGGAYWGGPSNVWAVWGWIDGQVCVTYTRANSRADAIAQIRGE